MKFMGGLKMNNNQAMIEYVLNKFLPYFLLGVLLVYSFPLTNFVPYVIIGLVFFIDKYSFKIGRSVGEYENNIIFRTKVDKEVEKDD